MRYLQIVLFFIGLIAFILAAIYAGGTTGDIMWRAGMAILLIDVVCVMLWGKSNS